jgi:hypothetical protein
VKDSSCGATEQEIAEKLTETTHISFMKFWSTYGRFKGFTVTFYMNEIPYCSSGEGEYVYAKLGLWFHFENEFSLEQAFNQCWQLYRMVEEINYLLKCLVCFLRTKLGYTQGMTINSEKIFTLVCEYSNFNENHILSLLIV